MFVVLYIKNAVGGSAHLKSGARNEFSIRTGSVSADSIPDYFGKIFRSSVII